MAATGRRGTSGLYGMALDACVLYSQQFSELEAAFSGYFSSVGILIDMTIPSELFKLLICKEAEEMDFTKGCQQKTVSLFYNELRLGQKMHLYKTAPLS
jgi:hypothetical protein